MKTILAIFIFIGAYWAVSNIPVEWSMPLGLIALAGMFGSLVVLGVKWVRNV